jgi:hypothetical protein
LSADFAGTLHVCFAQHVGNSTVGSSISEAIAMTLAEYSLTAFALFNGGRVIAYVPQMIRVYRDPNGAAAVSLMTWTLFTAANVATVLYALINSDDRVVAGVFGLNALGCLVVVGLTAVKRIRHFSTM